MKNEILTTLKIRNIEKHQPHVRPTSGKKLNVRALPQIMIKLNKNWKIIM